MWCGHRPDTVYTAKPQLMSSRNSEPDGEMLFRLLSILTLRAVRGVECLTQIGHQGKFLAVCDDTEENLHGWLGVRLREQGKPSHGHVQGHKREKQSDVHREWEFVHC